MGQALARAKKGTSASGAVDGKLDFNIVNDSLVTKIVEFIAAYPTQHAEEGKLAFKKPLSWVTALQPTEFIGRDYETRGDGVSSTALTSNGQPIMELHKVSNRYVINASTIDALGQILEVAGDRKLAEARSCLEATKDPMTSIVGDRFATVEGEDMSAYRYMEEIMRGPKKDEGDAEMEAKKCTLRLVLDLQKLDTELLKAYVDRMSSAFRLSMDVVESQVKLIKEFCGEDEEKHVLEDIVFASSQTVFNGCRSPPWRQIHGDLAYIEVKPHDVDNFWVTANVAGYYEIKGWLKDKKELSYEKAGEVHKNLMTLIRTKSPRFAELMDRQSWDIMAHTKIKKPSNGKRKS